MLVRMKTLGERVKARREKLKAEKRLGKSWSQTYVAKEAGVLQQTYAFVENGQTKNPGFIVELAAALLTTVDWLKYGKGDEESPLMRSGSEIAEDPAADPYEAALDAQKAIIRAVRLLSPQARQEFDLDGTVMKMREIIGDNNDHAVKKRKSG